MLTFLAPCGHPTALQPSAHAHEGCSFRLIPAVDPTTRERDLDRRMRAAMRCGETFLFDRGASPKLAGSLPHLLALPMVLRWQQQQQQRQQRQIVVAGDGAFGAMLRRSRRCSGS